MDVVEQLRQLYRGRPQAELRALAKRSDVSFFTLRKVVSGETQDPRHGLVEKVRPHLPRRKR